MNPLYTFSPEELAYLWALHGEPHAAHLVLRAEMGEDVLQKPLMAQRMIAAGHSLLARGFLEQDEGKDRMRAIQPVRELFTQIAKASLFLRYAWRGFTGVVFRTSTSTIVQEQRYGVVYDFWLYPRDELLSRLAERLDLPEPQNGTLPAPVARVTPALFERILSQVKASPTDALINLAAAGFDAAGARELMQTLGNPATHGEVTLLSALPSDAGFHLSGWRFVRGSEALWWFPLGQPDQVLPAYQLTPAQSADLLATWFGQVDQVLAQTSQLLSGETSLPNVMQEFANSGKLGSAA